MHLGLGVTDVSLLGIEPPYYRDSADVGPRNVIQVTLGFNFTLSQPGAASAFSKLNFPVTMIVLGAILLSFKEMTSASVYKWHSNTLSLFAQVLRTDQVRLREHIKQIQHLVDCFSNT